MGEDSAFELVLWSTDVSRLAAFLQAVAGVDVLEHHPGYAVLAVGGARVLIHADESYRGHPWHDALHREGAARGIGAELRLRVSDVATRWARALRMGGLAVQPPYDDAGVRECQVMGPDGFLLCLWEPAPGG
ncbi:MAG: VOC family protein [Chloroflexota bacterium]